MTIPVTLFRDLSHYLDESERFSPAPFEFSPASISDLSRLFDLACQLRALVPVRPRGAWLRASKRRVLSRFSGPPPLA